MKAIGYLLMIAIVAVMYPCEGWVISEPWRWFVEPLGVPHLSVSQGIGLALIGGLLCHQLQPAEPKQELTDEAQWERIGRRAGYLARPFVAYGIGALVHWLGGAL